MSQNAFGKVGIIAINFVTEGNYYNIRIHSISLENNVHTKVVNSSIKMLWTSNSICFSLRNKHYVQNYHLSIANYTKGRNNTMVIWYKMNKKRKFPNLISEYDLLR